MDPGKILQAKRSKTNSSQADYFGNSQGNHISVVLCSIQKPLLFPRRNDTKKTLDKKLCTPLANAW